MGFFIGYYILVFSFIFLVLDIYELDGYNLEVFSIISFGRFQYRQFFLRIQIQCFNLIGLIFGDMDVNLRVVNIVIQIELLVFVLINSNIIRVVFELDS